MYYVVKGVSWIPMILITGVNKPFSYIGLKIRIVSWCDSYVYNMSVTVNNIIVSTIFWTFSQVPTRPHLLVASLSTIWPLAKSQFIQQNADHSPSLQDFDSFWHLTCQLTYGTWRRVRFKLLSQLWQHVKRGCDCGWHIDNGFTFVCDFENFEMLMIF